MVKAFSKLPGPKQSCLPEPPLSSDHESLLSKLFLVLQLLPDLVQVLPEVQCFLFCQMVSLHPPCNFVQNLKVRAMGCLGGLHDQGRGPVASYLPVMFKGSFLVTVFRSLAQAFLSVLLAVSFFSKPCCLLSTFCQGLAFLGFLLEPFVLAAPISRIVALAAKETLRNASFPRPRARLG